ncbi:hypothetical protein QYE76_064716 [Lolium multiflorum]|uniref:F-box/LRR-repeat protein 15/At3g58940/PEG3-like LRR domain-containing protein n=1 Tax=Lolium multiflorum TaxID=4521 RepID=A0AAD8S714_LOLMU|nr:hypothetical protein QYE76_064716 [Lolium multiflorum]
MLQRPAAGAAKADTEPVAEERGDIDLPCFERATSITLKLGFLGLALPSSGVFARLRGLQLVDVRLHGQSGLGELLSSQRCPSLKSVIVRQARGLDSFNIHSESLLNIELSNLHCLQQLTVIAPVLESLRVKNCFTNPLDPDLSVANISAPQLKLLDWMNAYDPSSIQLDNMMHLENLGIKIFILEGEEEAVERNLYCMTLLWRFDHIRTLDLLISYPPDICTAPYLMEHMPKLHITILALGIIADGHCFGASVFDVLMRCRGLKRLDLDFLPRSQLGEQTPCPSGCICDQQPKWKTEELALNCLEEIEIHDMRGTEHEVALVQRLFHWAIVLKRLKIVLHELITESKAKELRQLLLSFSRLDICIDISMFVP